MRYRCLLSLLVCALGIQPALAAPVTTTLTVSGSTLLLTVDALGAVTSTANLTLHGTQGITLGDFTPALSLDGGILTIQDESLTLDLDVLGEIRAGLVGAALHGLKSTRYIPMFSTGTPDSYAFDPGYTDTGDQTSIVLDTGLLTYQGTGPFGSLLGEGTLDFAGNFGAPRFNLPSLGQVGTLTRTVLNSSGGATTYGLLLVAPISTRSYELDDPAPRGIFLSARGTIVATGSYVALPEPATVWLAVIGMLAAIPLVRRRMSGERS